MSITDEKWSLDSEDPRTIVDENGNPILTCNMPGATLEDDYETARAIAVLPEALALLRARLDLDAEGHPQCPCEFCGKARVILRRAGVLE